MTQDLALHTDPLPKPEQSAKMALKGAFTPANLTEAIALSKMIAASELAPKDYRNKPANVLIAMQMGAEVGLAPMQALQSISIINGRPSLWGDAALGIVQVSPMYESHKEWITGAGDLRTAYCTVKRRNQEAHTASFSVAQAKLAGLWDKKPSPWQTYPDRMIAMRARGFALRDKFSDALRGLILAEEAMDIPVDTSEAKRQRESGAISIETLAPSMEPNRGHGNEGMVQEAKELPAKPQAKTEQEKKTSSASVQTRFVIMSLEELSSGDNRWLKMSCIEPGGEEEFIVNCWHKSLWEYLLPDALVTGEVVVKTSKGRRYTNLEHVSRIDNRNFVDNLPVEAEATAPIEEQPF